MIPAALPVVGPLVGPLLGVLGSELAANTYQTVTVGTVTLPVFDSGAIIDTGMSVVSGFAVLMVTVAAIRLGPKFISAIRRMLSAATGR